MVTLKTLTEKAVGLSSKHLEEVSDFIDFLKKKQRPIPLRSVAGLWKDLAIQLSDEDLTQARQEMWSTFGEKTVT